VKKRDTLKDLPGLYELSLAIGNSIDLVENCETFCHHLMLRKNLVAGH